MNLAAVHESNCVVHVIMIAEMSAGVFGRTDSLCPFEGVFHKADANEK